MILPMDILAENGVFATWLLEYGSIMLFGLLIAGIVAFPVPEETLLVISGICMHSGHLSIPDTLLAAYAGSICGITASYFIGNSLGHFFIHKYGHWVGMTEARLAIAHQWFQKYGTWMLFIGYFIPGVRHFTGFFAGTTKLKFKTFALFAYSGALVWVTLFLSIGYFFGNYWHVLSDVAEANTELLIYISIAAFGLSLIYFFRDKLQSLLRP